MNLSGGQNKVYDGELQIQLLLTKNLQELECQNININNKN